MRVISAGFLCAIALTGLNPVHGLQASNETKQPELTTLKADFLPGEKTLFFDDFTDMTAGDAPAHFKVRGPAPELRAGANVRQLTAVQSGSLYPNVTGLPKNFTYEAEVQFENARNARTALILYSGGKEALIWWVNAAPTPPQTVLAVKGHTEELGRRSVNVNFAQPAKLALWVQNGRVRAFMNGDKQVDANQVDLPAIDKVEILSAFSQTIMASGRYVSHGILFDTGSDVIKAESASVIQAIARGLDSNPNLKIRIEGHTDSVGNAAANLDLSKRRAEAVKGVLASQFKIDVSRLATAGLGSTKPIESNDSPQGRSQNRRVEFVKQ
jgi:OOP family OmpA-OmpF porin